MTSLTLTTQTIIPSQSKLPEAQRSIGATSFQPTPGGNGQFAFAPNSASVDGKYKSLLGTSVETTISNSEIISAGRMKGGNFWFMTTDKADQNISYTSNSIDMRLCIILFITVLYNGNTGSN